MAKTAQDVMQLIREQGIKMSISKWSISTASTAM